MMVQEFLHVPAGFIPNFNTDLHKHMNWVISCGCQIEGVSLVAQEFLKRLRRDPLNTQIQFSIPLDYTMLVLNENNENNS